MQKKNKKKQQNGVASSAADVGLIMNTAYFTALNKVELKSDMCVHLHTWRRDTGIYCEPITAYFQYHNDTTSGISLGIRPVDERRRYIVTTSLIGWAHA